MKTKFPATVMVFGVVSSEGHNMPPHIFDVGLKVNIKVYLNVLKSNGDPLVQSGGRWQTLSVAAELGAGPHVQRDLGLASGVLQLCTLLSLAPLLPRPEPSGLLRLVIRREQHHQHDLPQHQSQPDRRYPPSSRRRLWKRHAPSSGFVSRRWLRLEGGYIE